ncbi:response regulator [Paenibacillus arenilitoris]|uniref:Response regulator n=1 Tax=Paenibacillus arenilitoris TaxID=2772299 RepID=A0A927H452_9BACL|nr:response regulator [Paenibacillus arenilitoris]MBD2868036.1 response regulator [Paenibacillus arenilitoris]
MYNVLLADDERLDLDGMRTFIPWEELGMRVAACATNGFDACKALETEPIDILVTDVRMPHMSGLELAKRALERRPGIKIIFISGYQDFSYAKQALSLNAVNYVLKPMDDQELIDTLAKVRDDLDRERVREAAYGQMIPIVKNEYLLQLLEGGGGSKTIEALNREYAMDRFEYPGFVAVLEIDGRAGQRSEGPGDEKEELERVMSVGRRLGAEHMCKINRTRLAVIAGAEGGRAMLEKLVRAVRDECGFTVTAGVGESRGSLAEMSGSYRQAAEALELKIFYGKGEIIAYGEARPAEKEEIRHLDAKLEALFAAMANYELVLIHDKIDDLFQMAKSLKSPFTLRHYSLYILMKLDDYLQRTNENAYRLLGMELDKYDMIAQFETIGDIRQWLRRRVYEISETIQEGKQKKNWKLVKQLIEYMKERTQESLTLRDLAVQFSLSPNYLGHIFKEETGKNFSEFFIQLRMERSCELLKTTNMKIYEIADRVGYRYLPYFSRQFKETYGMTPLEYRRA